MARSLLDLGYSVDVINWTNNSFTPDKEYSLFIDVRWNLQRLSPFLNKDCVKIMYVDVCHITFQNAAETGRLLDLQRRRGFTLRPRRYEPPNRGIEYADCAILLGNEFTQNTFRFANKPIYPIPVLSLGNYPFPESKDFESCRKNFVWFGSGGLVRKGLDLVLDAFAEMPDLNLTVCGPVEAEDDFFHAYRKELCEIPNIQTVGWVDVASRKFLEICNQNVALIYPSCSEGQSGGVVTCLQAGLIPLVSYETGLDVSADIGAILKSSSIAEIKDTVRSFAALPAERLKTMAQNAWNYARAHHTRDSYTEAFKKAVIDIVDRHSRERGIVTVPMRDHRVAGLSAAFCGKPYDRSGNSGEAVLMRDANLEGTRGKLT
ncbi:MAG TPA: glycosyltransferase [Candidatus Binatia bacterium]|jgi:glycosyltransferase involved in cell wall biosynthesis|nr:glycosyltransferase [Candidatus Binatia bacterium]